MGFNRIDSIVRFLFQDALGMDRKFGFSTRSCWLLIFWIMKNLTKQHYATNRKSKKKGDYFWLMSSYQKPTLVF